MKKPVLWMTLVLALFAFSPAFGEEAPKPLGPGWLSLDGSVGLLDKRIEDGKSALEKALFGTSISGFLDTSWTWSSNRPRGAFDRDISGRYFDQDHNDIVFNDFNLTLEKPEKDWGVGFKLVGDFGRTGELLREATFWGSNKFKGAGNGGEPSAELREAFLTTTIPVGEGLQIKAGKFVTLLGTEILPTPSARNPNISNSYMFLFAIPFTHTGALFTYPVLKTLSISAGPVTGWDDPHDNNGQPSLLAGINFTPADVFALASSIVYGPEQRHKSGPKRFTWSNVATIKPMDPLTIFLEYTYGHDEKITASLRDATWQGIAAIASVDWTDRFNTALRGEVFHDADGIRTIGSGLFGATTPRDVALTEVTLTGAYKFTAKLVGRAEVRQDWADKSVFAKRNTSVDKNQTTFALQMIYGF